MAQHPAEPMPTPRTALLLAYPGFTALDLFGPQYFLAALPGISLRVVAHGRAPVQGDGGVTVVPACTFATAPTGTPATYGRFARDPKLTSRAPGTSTTWSSNS